MPQTSYTAYDTTGQTKMTDMDQVAEQRRREMQDQAFRGALLNNQNNMQREGWGRQDAMQQAGLTAQERISAANNANQLAMGGSFQDRTAANAAQLSAQMRPAQTMADLEREKWGEGAGLRGAKNSWEQALLDKRLAMLNGMSGGGEQSANDLIKGGFSIKDPEGYGVSKFDSGPRQGGGPNNRVMLALMGIDPSVAEDPQDRMVRQTVAQAMAAKLASGEIDPQQFQAAIKGDYSGIPVKQASSVTADQQLQALDSSIDTFGSKDAATFGNDPGEEDVARIIAERDRAAQAIRAQNPRISPEQAVQDANFRIEQRLKPYADRWGTEWVARLREVMSGHSKAGLSQQDLAAQNLSGALGRTTEQGAMVGTGNKWLTR